jgi:hypothetical protein
VVRVRRPTPLRTVLVEAARRRPAARSRRSGGEATSGGELRSGRDVRLEAG